MEIPTETAEEIWLCPDPMVSQSSDYSKDGSRNLTSTPCLLGTERHLIQQGTYIMVASLPTSKPGLGGMDSIEAALSGS